MSRIILASQSPARRALLEGVKIPFEAIPSKVDEEIIKRQSTEQGLPLDQITMVLAIAKARAISEQAQGAYVIGADQILGLGNEGFDKPVDMAEAALRLARFSGQTHCLYTAACVVRDGSVIWQKLAVPSLTMRGLTDHDISAYLAVAGEGVLGSVGAYQLEGPGLRLFEVIEGDYFSILGLPLLDLLGFLRNENLLAF